MSHKIHYLAIAFLFLITPLAVTADDTPTFSAWLECIDRGPYDGMAQAHVAYSFSGRFNALPEDSRLLGDTATGSTVMLPYPIEPGDHDKAIVINVGADKVVVWKVIFLGKLNIVTAWDNPEVPDCPIELNPEATPEAVSNA